VLDVVYDYDHLFDEHQMDDDVYCSILSIRHGLSEFVGGGNLNIHNEFCP
jgi:hypothetical protein